jgi:hypothetical protein
MSQTNSNDVVWGWRYGTWGDVNKILKAVKKFHKDGFYVTVDEVSKLQMPEARKKFLRAKP